MIMRPRIPSRERRPGLSGAEREKPRTQRRPDGRGSQEGGRPGKRERRMHRPGCTTLRTGWEVESQGGGGKPGGAQVLSRLPEEGETRGGNHTFSLRCADTKEPSEQTAGKVKRAA